MGFRDVIYSAGDRLKGITSDLSTAKRTTYDCTSAAVTKIDQAVRVDSIRKLPQYLPDDETRAQIGVFTTTLANQTGKYVVYEGFKHILEIHGKLKRCNFYVGFLKCKCSNIWREFVALEQRSYNWFN